MRYLYAKFEGYIGFYTGLGLSKLEIDFTKCKHNIVLISGMNGCGKSTLMNSLSVFPDDSSSFVNFLDGIKTLRLINNNDIYDIIITSPSDGKGGRKQSKAFIKKNGIELNENGNITSYKEIIFSEFELDSNYISLSRLSSIDRGLGDKKPAERKRFASSIIDNMEVYNNIYKTLNKKSLVLKSTINNLHTKIQNIGSKENLEMTLNKLESSYNTLSSKIESINNNIVAIQAKNSIDDNDSKEIESLSRNINELLNEVEDIKSRINFFASKIKIKPENIEDQFNKDKELFQFYSNKVDSLTNEWRKSNDNLSNLDKNINDLEASINMYNSENNKDIEDAYTESNNRLNDIIKDLKSLKFDTNTSLIIDISNLISFYNLFISMIDKLYDGLNIDDLNILSIWSNNTIQDKINIKNNLELELNKINENLIVLNEDLRILSTLDNRPNNCKIDNCVFISSALELKKKYKNKSINNIISSENERKEQLQGNIKDIEDNISYLNSMIPKKTYLDQIRELIFKNRSLLELFNDDLFNTFENKFINMNNFNNQRDPRRFIDGLASLQLYEQEKKINDELKLKYESLREKTILMNSNKVLLKNMKEESKELSLSIIDLKSEIDKYSSLKESINNNISKENEYYNEYKRYKDKNNELEKLQIQMKEFTKKSSKALESVDIISKLKIELDETKKEIIPLSEDINRIKGQLVLLDSYYKDYNDNIEKNNTIEVVKKYCSPTGGGIQTLFIQIYMRKTLEISNQILSMLFNGQYKLLDFIINEKEFRIPFVGPSGLPADDISNGSMSQVQMMGMVINLALLYQASTKFNIAYLDEIGSGLDNHNQGEFIKVIYYISKYLNMEQVFMICHSLAVDESGVDIIKLKDYEEFASTTGNIIYDFNDEK